jgi:hypothetical protein
MLLITSVVLLSVLSFSVESFRVPFSKALHQKIFVQKDEFGYEIKPRDWFNGLSKDAGASLTDPRAIPTECKDFARKVSQNDLIPSLDETIAFIDSHYTYFAVRLAIYCMILLNTDYILL